MTAQTRSTLKAVFETGDTPAGSDYADMIDSAANVADTTAQSFASDISAPKFIATTEVSAGAGQVNTSAVNTTRVSAKGAVFIGGTVTANGDARVYGRITSGLHPIIVAAVVTVNMGSTAAASAVTIPTGSHLIGIDYQRK